MYFGIVLTIPAYITVTKQIINFQCFQNNLYISVEYFLTNAIFHIKLIYL